MTDDGMFPQLCSCGTWNPYDAIFCRNCGSKLKEELDKTKEDIDKPKLFDWLYKLVEVWKR